MIECSKILFVINEELKKTLRLEELESTLAIEAHFLEWDEAIAQESGLFDLGILQCHNDSYDSFIDGLKTLVENGNSPFSRFIIVSDTALTADLSNAWQLGMHCYVCVENDIDNVYHSLESFCRLTNENKRLEQQLKEASDIAVLSMSASSQLGEIIRFLEKSYDCSDYESLGALLNETLENMGVTGCGIIGNNTQPTYFGDQEKEKIWRRLLKEFKNKGRFIDIDNRTITNFESISVLARNLPEPGSEEHGRIKDVLFTLIEGAEARIKSIVIEQQAQIAEKAKVSFLSLMSHELRTPMNAILGFSGLLARKEEGEEISKRDLYALKSVDESANRLMNMISDILELSHINTNVEEAKSRIMIREVLQDILREAEEQATEKGLTFNNLQSDPNLTADIDHKRVQQIAKKLINNAIKFTNIGSITFNATSVFKPGEGDMLEITIEDTGPGISENQQNAIFEPFAIGEDYLTRQQDGAGLGLVLVQEFVKEMSGTLTLESTVGEGSIFKVLIPQYDHEPADIELF